MRYDSNPSLSRSMMAPVASTDDYYMILEVERKATTETITQAYKRLALKLHPDWNKKHDATAKFQKLVQAYQTLKDESKRRDYDLTHAPSNCTRPTEASKPPHDTSTEDAKIAALQKAKQDRKVRWLAEHGTVPKSIFDLKRTVQRLELDIKSLVERAAAEQIDDAWKRIRVVSMLSSVDKAQLPNEEERELEDRKRQERLIEKNLKERRLDKTKAELLDQEVGLAKAKAAFHLANQQDDAQIQTLHDHIAAREARKKAEEEQARKEQFDRSWQQQREEQLRKAKEAAEAAREARKKAEEEQARKEQFDTSWQQQLEEQLRKAMEAAEAARRLAELARQRAEAAARWGAQQEEHARETQFGYAQTATPMPNAGDSSTSGCYHDGWWPKIHGRAECPVCYEVWPYLLECPGCRGQACPKCQSDLRPRDSDYDDY